MIPLPNILDYDLKICRVVNLHPEENTVDVKIINKWNHKECYNTADMFEEYGDLIENVVIRMTTDRYYYASEEDKEEMEFNDGAWSMWLPDFFGNLPLYANIVVPQDPEGQSYIISCFRANMQWQSNMKLHEKSRQLSRRLFSTYQFYAVIMQRDENWENFVYTYYDFYTGATIDCGDNITDLDVGFGGEGASEEYFEELYGNGLAVVYDLTYQFGGWGDISHVSVCGQSPIGGGDLYIAEAYGEVETDAYWTKNQCTNDELVSIPTLGANSRPSGETILGVGDCSRPFKFTHIGGVVEQNSQFYYRVGGVYGKLSVGDSFIESNDPYSIDVISGGGVGGATYGLNYFLAGSAWIGTRDPLDGTHNIVNEVVDAKIYSSVPFKAFGRDVALESIINDMNLNSDLITQYVNLELKAFGFRGLDFGEPITLIEYL